MRLSPLDLTIAEAEAIEAELGEPWADIASLGTPRFVAAIATTILARDRPLDEATAEVRAMHMRDLVIVADDLPDYYAEGRPQGGRPLDAYVVAFSREPFCWPPDVVRRQSLRDLLLVSHSQEPA